ncbi:unnamed protein product [Phytophthora fragariaefolia]|uniref:Unnamed protein product n=1 Tax=Phytophthora fragariaefolia TaxID=1490495 RepID=A0A9W7D4D4_9STRA|nr:unnamed protein product [Phytophthora fragariaefolia]
MNTRSKRTKRSSAPTAPTSGSSSSALTTPTPSSSSSSSAPTAPTSGSKSSVPTVPTTSSSSSGPGALNANPPEVTAQDIRNACVSTKTHRAYRGSLAMISRWIRATKGTSASEYFTAEGEIDIERFTSRDFEARIPFVRAAQHSLAVDPLAVHLSRVCLPLNRPQFAALPLHFQDNDDPTVGACLLSMYPELQKVSGLRDILKLCMASLDKHAAYFRKELPSTHPLVATALFCNKEMLAKLSTSLVTGESPWMNSTGIPPHVELYKQLEGVQQSIDNLPPVLLDGMSTLIEKRVSQQETLLGIYLKLLLRA